MIEPPHRIKGRRPYLNDDLLDVAIPTLVAQRDDITYNPNGESNGFTLRQLKPTSSRSIHPVHDKLFRPIHRANKRQP
ncbi:hypothetical protein PGT21_008880 [Puccinia graminis f. sp. tritici]|uniref:Uncharacterized protein n=1 Tax=Puccinia graminis f. sp. tritici TaxID=56615 RepID=A0A5B0Q9U4_PUCGR|nr:hypothetical protein PGT21_008880 [Puccinia graminis f. sp. tritici]